MKKIIYLLMTALIVSCASLPKHQFDVKEVAPDTFVVTDKSFYDSNILVAKMLDGTIFVASSPKDTDSTDDLIQWIQDKWNPKKIIEVNTHFHLDGTGGNEAFRDAGAEIWASELTRKLHQEREDKERTLEVNALGPQALMKKRALDKRVVLAENTFNEKDGKEFDFKGEKVHLIYPGPAHSQDNVVVYFPKRKVLFGTCMIRSAQDGIGNMADADVQNWASSVKNIQKLEAKIVIPGHGPVGGPELIKRTIELAEKEATQE